MGRKKKRKTHSTKALPWRTEVKAMLDKCRTMPVRIKAIDREIMALRLKQGFDLEDRAALVEIARLEQEKEELGEFRDMIKQAVDMLSEDIRQFIELYYLSERPLSPAEVSERLSYCSRNFYYKRAQAFDLLAVYLDIKPDSTERPPEAS